MVNTKIVTSLVLKNFEMIKSVAFIRYHPVLPRNILIKNSNGFFKFAKLISLNEISFIISLKQKMIRTNKLILMM